MVMVVVQAPVGPALTVVPKGEPSQVMLMPVSPAPKPVPLIVVCEPGAPLDLLRVIPAVTEKDLLETCEARVTDPEAPIL